MADEHEDQGAADGDEVAGVAPSAVAADEEHAEMRAALDEIEAALDAAAGTIARMA